MSRGKQPRLSVSQRKHPLELHDAGTHTQEELAELFSVSRTTVYRELRRRAATASS
jgi:transposase